MQKPRSRLVVFGCAAGIIALLLPSIAAALWVLTGLPSIPEKFPPNTTPIFVTLTGPNTQDRYPLNSDIPVKAEATGSQPIESFELWVDGALMAVTQPPAGYAGKVKVNWTWTPASQGEHLLLVRARTAAGSADSLPVRVTITPEVGMSLQIEAKPGDTVASLAAEYGVPTERVIPAVVVATRPVTFTSTVSSALTLQDGTALLADGFPASQTAPLSTPLVIAGGSTYFFDTPDTHDQNLAGQNASGPEAAGEPAATEPDSPGQETSGEAGPLQLPAFPSGAPGLSRLDIDPHTGMVQRPLDVNEPLTPGQPVLIGLAYRPLPSESIYEPPSPPTGSTRLVVAASGTGIASASTGFTRGDVPPLAPTLSASVQGCNVHLYITDASDIELGFFVYRNTEPDLSLQRIALLEPNSGGLPLEFIDPQTRGTIAYTVAAFNDHGEAFSNPAIVQVDGMKCVAAPAPGTLEQPPHPVEFQNGILHLPYPVDQLYFYLTIDGLSWLRYPNDPYFLYATNRFYQGTEFEISFESLSTSYYYNEEAAAVAELSLLNGKDITLEAWGWVGGQLHFLGRDVVSFWMPSTLAMCNGTTCLGSAGSVHSWLAEQNLTLDHVRSLSGPEGLQIQWDTIDRGETPLQGLWQVSNYPFPADPILVAGIPTGLFEGTGVHEIPLGDLITTGGALPSEMPAPGSPMEALFNAFGGQKLPVTVGDTLYIRVIPFSGNQIAAGPTNSLTIHLVEQMIPDIYIPIIQDEPIYNVRILEFSPIHFAEPGVCPGALIVEETFSFTPLGANTAITLNAGQRLCPEIYSGQGEAPWYKLMFDFLVEGLSWISQMYESIKQAIVDVAAGALCGGDATCKAVLMAGLNAGLMALGIPPTLPNFDQLMSEGISYVAGVVAAKLTGTELAQDLIAQAAATGLTDEDDINQYVTDKLAEGLAAGYAAIKASNPNPGCLDAEEAHRRGVEPLCMEGLKTRLDPAGQRGPASVKIEITRRTDIGTDLTPAELAEYDLLVTTYVHSNPTTVGNLISIPNGSSFRITQPLSGTPFVSRALQIPAIAPGETVILPLVLRPTEYWVPGHKEAYDGWIYSDSGDYGCNSLMWDDWWKLYYNASIDIDVRVDPCPVYSDANRPLIEPECRTVATECIAGPMPNSIQPFVQFCQP